MGVSAVLMYFASMRSSSYRRRAPKPMTSPLGSRIGQISLPQTVVQVQKGKLVPVFGPKGVMEKALYPMPAWGKR